MHIKEFTCHFDLLIIQGLFSVTEFFRISEKSSVFELHTGGLFCMKNAHCTVPDWSLLFGYVNWLFCRVTADTAW